MLKNNKPIEEIAPPFNPGDRVKFRNRQGPPGGFTVETCTHAQTKLKGFKFATPTWQLKRIRKISATTQPKKSMKYRRQHRIRIVETLERYGSLRFSQLRSRWLDVCDAFITEESFRELLTELDQEEIISQSKETNRIIEYHLTDKGKSWIEEQRIKNVSQ